MAFNLRSLRAIARKKESQSTTVTRRRLRLECLEIRRLLDTAQFTWISDDNDIWGRNGNWHGEFTPGNQDTAIFTALGDQDTIKLYDTTTVGAILADSGSEKTIDLNGYTLETKQSAGLKVSDMKEGAGLSPGAKLEITNSGGTTKTVTTSQVWVGYDGDVQSIDPHDAELTVSSDKVKIVSSGDLRVGGKNQGTLTLEYGDTEVDDIWLGGGVKDDPKEDVIMADVTVANNATLTADGSILIGTRNGPAAYSTDSKLVSKMKIDTGATVTVPSTKDVWVGDYHRGELTISGGAELKGPPQDVGPDITVGKPVGSPPTPLGKGTLTVEGDGSKLYAKSIDIGADVVRGAVTIDDEAYVEVAVNLQIGQTGTSNADPINRNTLDVTNDAELKVKGNLIVGRFADLVVDDAKMTIDGYTTIVGDLPGYHSRRGYMLLKLGAKVTVPQGIANYGVLQTETTAGLTTLPNGKLDNRGKLIPGSSPGEFKLDGDFSQEDPGVLEIELGGHTIVTEHDVLSVADYDDGYGGDATLGGTLELTLIDGFEPEMDDEFTVLRAAASYGGVYDDFDRIDATDAPLDEGGWAVEKESYDEDSDGWLEVILKVVPANITITSFRADGEDMLVDYTISGGSVAGFDIGIYTSSDGAQLDDELMTQRVDDPDDLSQGDHTVRVVADLDDIDEDYYLGAMVDAAFEVQETDESDGDNIGFFVGGAFFDGNHGVSVHFENCSFARLRNRVVFRHDDS